MKRLDTLTILLTFLLLHLQAGCFDLNSLEKPFSCAKDGACPNGYICNGENKCQLCEPPLCECDPSQQDCSSASAPICDAFLLVETIQSRCVQREARAKGGEVCENNIGGQAGLHNCQRGFYCQSLTATSTCAAFCKSSRQCQPGQQCIGLFWPKEPAIGVCMLSCVLFPSSGCNPGTTCRPYARVPYDRRVGVCTATGNARERESCSVDTDCAENLVCGQGVCRRLCNSNNPCPGLGACSTLPPSGSNSNEIVGFCR